MRTKDYFGVFFGAIGVGFIINILAYFIWNASFEDSTYYFIVVWFGLTILLIPVSRIIVEKSTTCKECNKSFALSKNGTEDIENFVKYKRESIRENGKTREETVPYNCKRYWQFMRCDNCGHEYKYEAYAETRA